MQWTSESRAMGAGDLYRYCSFYIIGRETCHQAEEVQVQEVRGAEVAREAEAVAGAVHREDAAAHRTVVPIEALTADLLL